MFGWLFQRKSVPALRVPPSGFCDLDVVGEAHYQDALNRVCGGKTHDGHNHECIAHLIPEPNNKFDKNAVRVVIDGRTVGYLSRSDAIEYHDALRTLGRSLTSVECAAVVGGGWDRGGGDEGHYGVRLDCDFDRIQ